MSSDLAPLGPDPPSLPEQLRHLQTDLPGLINGIYTVKSELDKEMKILQELMTAAGLSAALRTQTAEILLRITAFRSECLSLCSDMIPYVEISIQGIQTYDTSPQLFDRAIVQVLNVHNLDIIKALITQCKELLTQLIEYQRDLMLTQDHNAVAVNQVKQVSNRILSLLSGLGVGIAATLCTRLTRRPEWSALATMTGAAFVYLGVPAWWSRHQTLEVLHSGEDAVQKIVERIKEYDELLHQCETDLYRIKQNYLSLSLMCENPTPSLYKEQIKKYCNELLFYLKLLQTHSASRSAN